MKRNRKKTGNPAGKTHRSAATARQAKDALPDANRRDALLTMRNWGAVAAVTGAGGWYVVSEVQATIAEHDLSRIGNGIPTIVQIHDPRCQRCVALQRAARAALGGFEDGELQFLVANLQNAKGRQLAAAHGVGNVTLLFFDAAGKRQNVVSGDYTSGALTPLFRSHAIRYGAGSASASQ